MSTPDDQPDPPRREPSSRRGDDAEGGPGILAWTLAAVWLVVTVVLFATSPDPPERWRWRSSLALAVSIALRPPWPRV